MITRVRITQERSFVLVWYEVTYYRIMQFAVTSACTNVGFKYLFILSQIAVSAIIILTATSNIWSALL